MSFSLFFAFLSLTSMFSYPTLAEERNRELYFPTYYFFAERRLINHNIKTVQVKDLDLCELLCYLDDDCVSLNIKKDRDSATSQHECELNNSTHLDLGHDGDLTTDYAYFYRGAKNACGKKPAPPCKNNATCQSGFTFKGYRCSCTPGFVGEHCEKDVDECSASVPVCDVNANCQNTRGSYRCSCKAGFTGDGKTCTDVDECRASVPVCDVNANCQNTPGSYRCSCKAGFIGDGKTCTADIMNKCESNPCLNNGTCTGSANGYTCNCSSGFYGERCEIGLSIPSAILSGNNNHTYHLAHFLAPAVGNHSNWELCYEATGHHNWKASDFHSNCDYFNHTVTIIENHHHHQQYVFGGYTDIYWESPAGFDHGYTPNAFIFSLRNKEGLTPFKIMVKESTTAIIKNEDYGPMFGADNIVITENGHHSTAKLDNSFPAPPEVQDKQKMLAGQDKFDPEKVEVFFLSG